MHSPSDGSLTCLNDTSWLDKSQDTCHIPNFQGTPNWLHGQLVSKVCAQLSRSVVGLGGLEPPASPLSGVRSNHLSYRPGFARFPRCHQATATRTGGADRDRTDDPLLAKQVLSQLSYSPVEGLQRRRRCVLDTGALCGRLAGEKLLERR